jgi:hypothetical protein
VTDNWIAYTVIAGTIALLGLQVRAMRRQERAERERARRRRQWERDVRQMIAKGKRGR